MCILYFISAKFYFIYICDLFCDKPWTRLALLLCRVMMHNNKKVRLSCPFASYLRGNSTVSSTIRSFNAFGRVSIRSTGRHLGVWRMQTLKIERCLLRVPFPPSLIYHRLSILRICGRIQASNKFLHLNITSELEFDLASISYQSTARENFTARFSHQRLFAFTIHPRARRHFMVFIDRGKRHGHAGNDKRPANRRLQTTDPVPQRIPDRKILSHDYRANINAKLIRESCTIKQTVFTIMETITRLITYYCAVIFRWRWWKGDLTSRIWFTAFSIIITTSFSRLICARTMFLTDDEVLWKF